MNTDILRIRYLPLIWIPLLIGGITTGTTVIATLHLFIGWGLLLLGQNVLNDIVDKDRGLSLQDTELWLLFSAASLLGILLLREVPLIAASAFLLGVLYNVRANGVPLVETAVSVAAYTLLPFLSVSTDAVIGGFVLVLAVVSDFLHNLTDADTAFNRGPTLTHLTRAASVLGLGLTVFLGIDRTLYFLLPVGAFFIGVFTLTERVDMDGKTVGVYSGAMFAAYLVGIAVQRGLLI